MSDNDDIEVESDVSPRASSFQRGLSGGDSGRGFQRGDGGRGPGSRRLLPLPPGPGPPPSHSRPGSWPERPSEAGGGEKTRGLWDPPPAPNLPQCRRVRGLPLPPYLAQDPGDWDEVRPGFHCPDPGEGDGARDLSPRSAIRFSRDPRILWDEGGWGGVGSAQMPRAECEGRRQ